MSFFAEAGVCRADDNRRAAGRSFHTVYLSVAPNMTAAKQGFFGGKVAFCRQFLSKKIAKRIVECCRSWYNSIS